MALGASCADAYRAVFEDGRPENWCALGYEGRKVEAQGTGTGGLDELVERLEDAQVQYALLRKEVTDDGGDSKRVKFVYLVWVGESASALKKGQVTSHKNEVGGLFVGFHIEKSLYGREDLENLAEEIDKDLKKAGGANYDLGNSRSGVQAGGSASYKATSKAFFEQKDKETEVKGVVFDKGPLKKGFTQCDLGGRQMVAGAAEAKANTVGYNVEMAAQAVETASLDEEAPPAAEEPAETAGKEEPAEAAGGGEPAEAAGDEEPSEAAAGEEPSEAAAEAAGEPEEGGATGGGD